MRAREREGAANGWRKEKHSWGKSKRQKIFLSHRVLNDLSIRSGALHNFRYELEQHLF